MAAIRLAAVVGRLSSLERVERLSIEDLADEPKPLVQVQLRTVGGRDAGRLLAAVLQRVQSKVGEAADRLARGIDPDHAALFARAVGLVARRD